VRVVDFFSGIGWFSLGLERVGFKTVAFSEVASFPCGVLKKMWPNVPNLGDITTVSPRDIPDADLWCGGFPCQPFSTAARGRNRAVPLWSYWFRLISVRQPRWVVVENVPGIKRFSDTIFGDLERTGYSAVAFDIPACVFGSPTLGYRRWFVAKTNSHGKSRESLNEKMAKLCEIPEAFSWPDPPTDIRVDDGIPNRLDRLRCLGNAIVPQIASWIGQRIKEVEDRRGP